MDFAEVGGVYAKIAHEGFGNSGLVLTYLRGTKNELLNISPIFKVPIEMSLILFILVNIYKSGYVIYHMNRLMITLFTGITIVALILERTAVVTNPSHIWINVSLCIILPLLMRHNRVVAVIFTSTFISYSTPLAFALDIFFISCACLRNEGRISPEFYTVNLGYIGVCSLISIYLNFEVTPASAITMSAAYFIVTYAIVTLLYMVYRTGYNRGSRPLYVQVELVTYILFPMMLDIFCGIKYGKKLTYSIPYLKSL